MTDFLTPKERSALMSRVKSVDTAPEIALRKVLHRLGFRFRLHRKELPGCPDIVLPKYRAVVFVHGCFWHRHKGCRMASTPKSNSQFWIGKFKRNVERDKRILLDLRKLGWRVFVVWECELKSKEKASAAGKKLAVQLRNVAN